MLRCPKFELATPTSVSEAIALLAEAGPSAVILAGGTDLVPNLKHELVTPGLVVSLARIPGLDGIRRAADGALVIGAMTSIADVAASALVREHAPALAQAAGLVAGPQLRTMGTLGGNVMLETRCQWYNQSYFWRQALGFCIKKDGTKCHVVEGGAKCVAAASNDSAPALMTLDAELAFEGVDGSRSVPIEAFWLGDGVQNKKSVRGEILVEVRVPKTPPGHRGAYGKLRERGSIDFPLLGVAARIDVDHEERVTRADLVVTALAARPHRVQRASELLQGATLSSADFTARVAELALLARKQCHPLDNVPGDAAWRKEMVPVYVRRTFLAAAARSGPVHHV
ncbi:MAG TPA: FAD binding domain-containing protein [Planctomycetota bacterium]|nr:FAD binding domain-containing protein [Planctomycetota bacterium]